MEHLEYCEVREVWDVQWSSLLLEMGYVPILLSVNYTLQELEVLDLDGVIFTGGNDLSAVNDNELSKMRDRYETRVLEFSLNKNLPVIGICRGMQFITYYFGDSLEPVSGHVATRHTLKLKEGFPYSELLSAIDSVNSYHNYGFRTVNDNWFVLATSSDGVIKAMIHKTKKIFTHMWHPEREQPFKKAQLKLLQSFIEA